jgi:hypothetical protein
LIVVIDVAFYFCRIQISLRFAVNGFKVMVSPLK